MNDSSVLPQNAATQPIAGSDCDDEAVALALAESERVAADGSLKILSRRTERQRKKLLRKQNPGSEPQAHLLDLPLELLAAIITYLPPSDVFRLSRTCQSVRTFIRTDQSALAGTIIQLRYPVLAKCFHLPALLRDLDVPSQEALHQATASGILNPRTQRYQHVQPLPANVVCSCWTCVHRWNALCVVVDFAHWQHRLDVGKPLPVIARGTQPAWNESRLRRNGKVVGLALRHPLWYAAILEAHLASVTNSIRRHAENKGDKRWRFAMTKEDRQSGLDVFLESKGPPTLDFPFHRDNYYMLEAYLPNRGWDSDSKRWLYQPASQHDKDLGVIKAWLERRKRHMQENAERQREESEEAQRQKQTINDAGPTGREEQRMAEDLDHRQEQAVAPLAQPD